jgi:hypothetical protein
MDDEMKRLCQISYTIMSATWSGRKTPAQKAELDRKREEDRRAVDAIMAGYPPTRAQRGHKPAESPRRASS